MSADTAVRFQSLPPLSPEEYAALEKTILDHGVLVPILVDQDDVVIDGHHRQKIAKHDDLPCPREVKSGFTDTEKRTLALSLNIDRRHLTREQKRALVSESITADPQLSDREHGRRTGVDHKTAAKARDELEGRGEIPHVPERVDSVGRQQPASKSPRSEQKPRRGPITDDARRLSLDLGRINKRLEKLVDDDRFNKNSDGIGCAIRPEVAHGLKVLLRLDRAIHPGEPIAVLNEITKTLQTVVVGCHFAHPKEIEKPVLVQHVAAIRDCLDAIHDLVDQWVQ